MSPSHCKTEEATHLTSEDAAMAFSSIEGRLQHIWHRVELTEHEYKQLAAETNHYGSK
jgi:hypothetical protein